MANIDTELAAIKSAIYGKDVRDSIHDAIKAINDGVGEDISDMNEVIDAAKEEIDDFVQGELDDTLESEVLPAQGKAVGSAVADLKSALYHNGNVLYDFGLLSTDYYTYDGYTLTADVNDARSEASIPINQRFHVEAGKKYIFSADEMTEVTIFLYDPETRTFLFNVPVGHSDSYENIFTSLITADCVFKANVRSGAVHTIVNPILMDYDLWEQIRGVGIAVKLHDGITDDENINRAINFASGHKISKVFIPEKTGDYIINSPIQMMSNIILEVDKNAKLKLADGSNCPIVQNKNLTASAAVSKTDKNITIIGGIWDGNSENQTKWVDVEGIRTLTVLFKFSGVDCLTIKDCQLTNSTTYGFLGCNIDKCIIERCVVDVGDMESLNNGDGIHFLGACENVTIRDCNIHSEDNCIAINADDVNHGYACFNGPINDVKLINNYINNYDGGQGVLLLSAESKLSNVVVDGLYGEGGYCLKIDNFGLMEHKDGIYENIDVRNVNFTILKNPDYAIRCRGDMEHISFKNIKLIYPSTYAYSGNLFTVFEFRTSIADGAYQYNTSTLIQDIHFDDIDIIHKAEGKELFGFKLFSGAYIRNMIINNLNIIDPAGTVMPLYTEDATIHALNCSNWNTENLPYGFIRTANASYGITNAYLNDFYTDYKSLCGVKFRRIPSTLSITGLKNGWFYCPYSIPNLYIDNSIVEGEIFNSSYRGYFRAGQLVSRGNSIYYCITSGSPLTTEWESNTEYSVGQCVRADEYVLICIQAGTSGETLTIGYADFDDNTVRWRKLYNGTSQFRLITLQ